MATSASRPGFLSRLMPSSGGALFFDLFEQHADRTREAASLLAAMLRGATTDPARQAERVKEVESQGDEITHTVIERLHQTFITPIDRGDIHELISRMDDVLDLIESSSERIWLYEIRKMEPDAVALADVLEKAVEEMGAAIRGLRDQLGPETDAEDRPSGRQDALDQGTLDREKRMLFGLVDRHRSAEHDQAPDAAQVARRRLTARQVEVAMVDAILA